MEMDGMRVQRGAAARVAARGEEGIHREKTHCISNPPCTFYNDCVYLLQERKNFWRRLQVKSLLFLPARPSS